VDAVEHVQVPVGVLLAVVVVMVVMWLQLFVLLATTVRCQLMLDQIGSARGRVLVATAPSPPTRRHFLIVRPTAQDGR